MLSFEVGAIAKTIERIHCRMPTKTNAAPRIAKSALRSEPARQAVGGEQRSEQRKQQPALEPEAGIEPADESQRPAHALASSRCSLATEIPDRPSKCAAKRPAT
jgi:hypothetical protein